MHVVPGPWLLAFLNGAVLLTAVGVAAYVLQRDSGNGGRDDETWRESAADLAREVQQTASAADGRADHDRVARRLLPLSGRIQRHVRTAPPSVEERTYRDLFELGVACQQVAVEHRPVTRLDEGVFLEDRLERLRAEADALEASVEG